MSVVSKAILHACLLACAVALSACGDRSTSGTQPGADQDDALPTPDQPGSSITGMSSRPGPGEVPLSGEPPPAIVAEPADQVDLLNPETGLLPGAATEPVDDAASSGMPAEPTPQDAVAVIRDYYAAIDSGSHARAYALWSDGGKASKQTPQQFADGFADTAHVVATTGEPGNVDAGAGQRYIQVPVTLTATRTDGSVHRYAGSYTLHRAVVDGATDEQRAWRIASADLRELQQ